MGDRADYATFTARRNAKNKGPEKTEPTGLAFWRRPEDRKYAERAAERIRGLSEKAAQDRRKAEEFAAQSAAQEAHLRDILDACED